MIYLFNFSKICVKYWIALICLRSHNFDIKNRIAPKLMVPIATPTMIGRSRGKAPLAAAAPPQIPPAAVVAVVVVNTELIIALTPAPAGPKKKEITTGSLLLNLIRLCAISFRFDTSFLRMFIFWSSSTLSALEVLEWAINFWIPLYKR